MIDLPIVDRLLQHLLLAPQITRHRLDRSTKYFAVRCELLRQPIVYTRHLIGSQGKGPSKPTFVRQLSVGLRFTRQFRQEMFDR